MKRRPQGFIALISVVILSAALLAMTFGLSQAGYLTRFTLLSNEVKEKSVGLAEACVDHARVKLAMSGSYSPINECVALNGDTCPSGEEVCAVLSVTTGTGADAGRKLIRTQATVNGAVTNMLVKVNATTLAVVSWEEVANHP